MPGKATVTTAIDEGALIALAEQLVALGLVEDQELGDKYRGRAPYATPVAIWSTDDAAGLVKRWTGLTGETPRRFRMLKFAGRWAVAFEGGQRG